MKKAPNRRQDEGALVARAKKGSREAFGILVERYQRRVVSLALAVVHNQEDALELAQEALVRAFDKLSEFEARSSFATWLYRITYNVAIDWLRRQGRHSVVFGEEAEEEIARLPAREDPFAAASRRELQERVKGALMELTPEHRTVILLREVEGLSYDEIGEVLQCPKGTVMSRLHYARNRLRVILGRLTGEVRQ
ncbi:MAG: sigma-70 family RNA polymerase sigma factor [Deltaproteobacteria bacterium]|nr:sigma-70 family RNA polymerase sigma factor [Deltaproteobacteria bacterium]